MSNSTKFAALLSDQINSLLDEMADLKTQYLSGQKVDCVFKICEGEEWPSDVHYLKDSNMTIGEFTYKFEELNSKMETLKLQQAMW